MVVAIDASRDRKAGASGASGNISFRSVIVLK